MKLKLSKRKRLPTLFLDEFKVAFPLWAYGFVRDIEDSNLMLDETAVHALAEVQKGFYRPPFSLKYKTVLDLGACCGETAWYYLKLGARKVYCVECDQDRVSILQRNKKVTGLNLEIIPEPLNLKHLDLSYDFIKCDVEGHEDILLEYKEYNGSLKPCVLEVHGKERKERFEKNGFRVVKTNAEDLYWIMNNFSDNLAQSTSKQDNIFVQYRIEKPLLTSK